MLKPGSLSGGESGISVLCSSQWVRAAPLGLQNQCMALLVSPAVLSPLGCAQTPGSLDQDGSSASPCVVLQLLLFPVPGVLFPVRDPV